MDLEFKHFLWLTVPPSVTWPLNMELPVVTSLLMTSPFSTWPKQDAANNKLPLFVKFSKQWDFLDLLKIFTTLKTFRWTSVASFLALLDPSVHKTVFWSLNKRLISQSACKPTVASRVSV
eukprot:PhF_6_TR5537/c0_g1_i1/m.7873